jgi:site-specific DNA recombinase
MRVVLYARVSTQRQAEQDLSIPDQFHQLEDYCARNKHEIVERFHDPGASATDDNRPGFQEMVAYTLDKKNGVEAILVLTTSRFFRDAMGARIYKQRLNRDGVRVVSITQEVADDPTGAFIEGIFELQDQYESQINGFHTLRGMKENARQGNFNGSRPPFGYQVETTEGPSGKPKRKLVPNPTEAELVRLMFKAYVDGVGGKRMGMKALTEYLNQNGHLARGGHQWTKMRVHERLADSTYVGERYFNRYDSKSKREKPRSEWIPISVPPIVEQELFDRATAIRRENRPSRRRPPSISGSKVLLTGLLFCGKCGARMGLETAKSGQYRYYNCSTFTRKGKSACPGNRVTQDDLDKAVLEHLSARLFTTERVREIVKQLATEIGKLRRSNNERVAAIQAKLQDVRVRIKRQYEAIESGAVDMTLVGDRLRELKVEEADLAIQVDNCQGLQPLPLHLFKEDSLRSIGENVRQSLLSPEAGMAKRYLELVVKRIEIEGDNVHIETNMAALLEGGLQRQKLGTANQNDAVLTIGIDWLPGADSNHQPNG